MGGARGEVWVGAVRGRGRTFPLDRGCGGTVTCCRKLFTDEEELWGDGRGGEEEGREGGWKI